MGRSLPISFLWSYCHGPYTGTTVDSDVHSASLLTLVVPYATCAARVGRHSPVPYIWLDGPYGFSSTVLFLSICPSLLVSQAQSFLPRDSRSTFVVGLSFTGSCTSSDRSFAGSHIVMKVTAPGLIAACVLAQQAAATVRFRTILHGAQ